MVKDIKLLIIAVAVALIWSISAAVIELVKDKHYYKKTHRKGYKNDMSKYKRTYRELIDYFDYKKAAPCSITENELPKLTWQQCDGIILGRIKKRLLYKDKDANGNLAFFGLPGSGKTALLKTTAEQFGGSIFAIDIKGDLKTGLESKRKIKCIEPAAPEQSAHFNPLSGIESMSDDELSRFYESMAAIIIPEQNGDNGAYFVEGARAYFCGIALYMTKTHNTINFPEIVKAALLGNPIDWVMKIRSSEITVAKTWTDSKYGENEKNLAGQYAVLAAALRPFSSENLAELLTDNGNIISINDLESGTDIYIKLKQHEIDVYAPLTSLIVNTFLSAFTQRKDASSGECIKPILFMLDEFGQLFIPQIASYMATLRSKKVSTLMCLQSLAQLDRYGKDKQVIIDCISYFVVLSVTDTGTRQWFSDLCGGHSVLKISNSLDAARKNGSKSVSEGREPLYYPEKFGNLGDNAIVYANGKSIEVEKINWFRERQ